VAHLIVMDYFFLPKVYLDDENKQGLGYGGDWVTKVTFFFSHGGHLALLPNDKFGSMEKMLQINPVPWCSVLSSRDAEEIHPLYMATRAITVEDPDGSYLRGVDALHWGRTNASAVEHYLNRDHPFLLLHSPSLYDSSEAARDKLKQLIMRAAIDP
jgi:hypothetical protein